MGIFISYRRALTAGEAGRVADRLVARFGQDNIFIDIDSIAPGTDFVARLREALDACDVLVAIIGRDWLTVRDDTGQRRLDDPNDFVRMEIASALEHGIHVIPVLVQNALPIQAADLPPALAGLATRQALEVRYEHFHQDANKLISVVQDALSEAESKRGRAARPDLTQYVKRTPRVISGSVPSEVTAVVCAMEVSLAYQGRPAQLSVRYLAEKVRGIPKEQRQSLPAGLFEIPDDLPTIIRLASQFGTVRAITWPDFALKSTRSRLMEWFFGSSPDEFASSQPPVGSSWEGLDGEAAKSRIVSHRLLDYQDIPTHLGLGRPIVAGVSFDDGWTAEDVKRSGRPRIVPRIVSQRQSFTRRAIVVVAFDVTDSSIRFVNTTGTYGWLTDFGVLDHSVARNTLVMDRLWAIEVLKHGSRQARDARPPAR